MNNQHIGALRGTPGSACPQPEPNATELPSSAPGRHAEHLAGLRIVRLRALARRRAKKPFAWISKDVLGTKLACPGLKITYLKVK